MKIDIALEIIPKRAKIETITPLIANTYGSSSPTYSKRFVKNLDMKNENEF